MAARTRMLVGLSFAAAAVLAITLIGASLLGSRGEAEVARTLVVGGAAETAALLRGVPQDGIALGSPDAPVTLVEYADLQCPYCAQWATGAFPAIVEEYVRPGDVRILFRGLAFIGPESDHALRAAVAAGMQGRLWNVVHLLYANQGPENGGWVSDALLRSVGESVAGLDADRMLAGGTSPPVERQLAAARRAAEEAGIRGTPSFQVGRTGGRLEPLQIGSLGPEEFRVRLDALLAG